MCVSLACIGHTATRGYTALHKLKNHLGNGKYTGNSTGPRVARHTLHYTTHVQRIIAVRRIIRRLVRGIGVYGSRCSAEALNVDEIHIFNKMQNGCRHMSKSRSGKDLSYCFSGCMHPLYCCYCWWCCKPTMCDVVLQWPRIDQNIEAASALLHAIGWFLTSKQ